MTRTTHSITLAALSLCAAHGPCQAAAPTVHEYTITVMTVAGDVARRLPRNVTGGPDLRASLRGEGGKVLQQVTVRTPADKPVNVDNGEEIPYVSDVGTLRTDAPVVTRTSVVRVGTHIGLVPTSRRGAIDVRYESDRLVKFVALDAGRQLGRLSRPQTVRQTFSTKVGDVRGVTHVMRVGRNADGSSTVLLVTRDT